MKLFFFFFTRKLSQYTTLLKAPIFTNPTATITTISSLDTHLDPRRCLTLSHFNQILSQLILSSLFTDTFASSRLLHFSTSHSSFIPTSYSFLIFSHIPSPNPFTYNTIIRALLPHNSPRHAFSVYRTMLINSELPDSYTFPLLIQFCCSRFEEFGGRMVQSHVWKMGFVDNVYVTNNLIHLYSACGNLGDARKVFDESSVRDSVSWSSILYGYVSVGDVEEAEWVFGRMPERKNVIASNSMIVLFGKKGRVRDARKLFDEMPDRDLVSWSALISCYEQNGFYESALVTFLEMLAGGVAVDEVVVVSVLSACANLSLVLTGKLVHGMVVKIGIESYVNLRNALIHLYSTRGEVASAEKLFLGSCCLNLFSWNSLLSAYLKGGDVKRARELFDLMPEKDLVSWSTMISGYAQCDMFSEALALFQQMQLFGFEPDEMTLVSVISACTRLVALDQGKCVHAYIRRKNLKINAILGTTLIDMYMKFGCVENAEDIFFGTEERGVSTWNALIFGLAMNGFVEKSLDTFLEMKRCDVKPNEITFVAVLGACRHMGLVDEGRHYFNSMIKEHEIEPNCKHYGCMVDLLGRAGLLNEAEELIESMPMPSDISTWGALLGACKKHGDIERGERLGKKLVKLQPNHDGFNVLLSNIYASKGNWDDVIKIWETMKKHGVVKTPGCSMIEVNGKVHEFLSGDKMHPQIKTHPQIKNP